MPLNPVKGNMYSFVSHTFNIIKGRCNHNCDYCFMKRYPQKDVYFDEKEIDTDVGTDLGRKNLIFVGSSCDMFAEIMPESWIIRVLDYCKRFPENTYLFQTKNPLRFTDLRNKLISMNCIIGTTIETNRTGFSYNAPTISERIRGMEIKGFRKFITIEPIIDFDVTHLVELILRTSPEFVNIGADSNKNKNYNLPEPSAFKVENLIKELEKFTIVKKKENLNRILLKK